MVHLPNPNLQIAVYIHIPFCVSKCHYCDFNSIGLGKNSPPELSYLESLRYEIEHWALRLKDFKQMQASTVFFGGGTPSLFQPSSIASILEDLKSRISFQKNLEITLEMNPKTASLEKMKGFRQAGVNRLSIGVQSLQNEILDKLGRAHDADDALLALSWAFETAFEKTSIDLMYGLPDQERSRLEAGLAQLSEFPLQHLSAYELIVEENTPFYERYRRGLLPLPPSSKVLGMRESIQDFTKSKGMRAYEISNYASPACESRHNLHYWNYDSFIGLGSGAVSFLRAEEISEELMKRIPKELQEDLYGVRLTNPTALAVYQKQANPFDFIEIEPISHRVAMGEFMMMGLRKIEGIRYQDFEEKFSMQFPEDFQEAILKASASGLLCSDAQTCRFTERGALLSNEVLAQFF